MEYPPISSAPDFSDLSDDNGPFIRIGHRLEDNGATWIAPSFASRRAFYIVKKKQLGLRSGGAIGGFLKTDDRRRSCTIGQLPPQIRKGIDQKSEFRGCNVVIIRREMIQMVTMSWLTYSIKVCVKNGSFLLGLGLFSGGRIRRNLTDMSWPMGVPMRATSGFAYDTGAKPVRLKPGQIMLCIVIAVVVAAGIFALRLAMRHALTR